MNFIKNELNGGAGTGTGSESDPSQSTWLPGNVVTTTAQQVSIPTSETPIVSTAASSSGSQNADVQKYCQVGNGFRK